MHVSAGLWFQWPATEKHHALVLILAPSLVPGGNLAAALYTSVWGQSPVCVSELCATIATTHGPSDSAEVTMWRTGMPAWVGRWLVGSFQALLKALMGREVSEVLDGVSFSFCRGLL